MTLNSSGSWDCMNQITLEALYAVEEYITFSVSVNSNGFSGNTNFCLSKASLHEAIRALTSMYDSLSGFCAFQDFDSDDYIHCEALPLGHIRFSGQLGGSCNDQFLRFNFTSDQTDLLNFIRNLQQME